MPQEKRSSFKENLYANLILWGWVLSLTGLGVLFHDNAYNNTQKFQERQKLYRELRKKRIEQHSHSQNTPFVQVNELGQHPRNIPPKKHQEKIKN